MGKQSRARVLAGHQAMAVARNIRVSPRKLNLVAQQIRGKKVDRALNVLTFSPKRIAGTVKKCLQSAIANAENNHDLDVDDLVVKEASVGKNLVMKRFHARARGNAGGIDITVDGMEAPHIGDLGRVARNVSLDPDHLLGAVTHAN